MKRYRELLKPESVEIDPVPSAIKILIGLAPENTCKWLGRFAFTIDTGYTGALSIPFQLAQGWGLNTDEIQAEENVELADGSVGAIPILSVDLKIETTNGTVILHEVPALLFEVGDIPLLGMGILQFFRYGVMGNSFTHFLPNEGRLELLLPWSGSLLDLTKTAPNVDNRTNVAPPKKRLELPKLPKKPEPPEEVAPPTPPNNTNPGHNRFTPPIPPNKPIPPW